MRKDNRQCKDKLKYSTAMLLSEIAITSLKIMKSFMFNALVFMIGFGLGYVIISQEIHYHAKSHPMYRYVEEISLHIQSLDDMDKEYSRANREFKFTLKQLEYDLAHEQHCKSNRFISCGSLFGKKIWK